MHLELACAGQFTYRAVCPRSGLVEHELDHVLVGASEEEPSPDAQEVDALAWLEPGAVLEAAKDASLARLLGIFPLAPWLPEALRLAEAVRARG